eukprot:1161361-Pyramimonas_sp.AAC.1
MPIHLAGHVGPHEALLEPSWATLGSPTRRPLLVQSRSRESGGGATGAMIDDDDGDDGVDGDDADDDDDSDG